MDISREFFENSLFLDGPVDVHGCPRQYFLSLLLPFYGRGRNIGAGFIPDGNSVGGLPLRNDRHFHHLSFRFKQYEQ